MLKSRSGKTAIVKVRVAGGAERTVVGKRESSKVGGGPRAASNAASPDQADELFRNAQAIEPPYDPLALCELYEDSSTLRPNVDAYATNIDGHGHHFKPLIDVKGADAFDKVYDAIYLDRLLKKQSGKVIPGKLEPEDEEVEAKIEELKSAMRVEQFQLQAFFESCTIGESFVALRRRTRQDVEVTGNGYWEVLRRLGSQAVAQFVYLHSHTMRLLVTDDVPTEVEIPVRTGPLEWGTETVQRRFRRFVQVTDMGKRIFFKEFGDPRVVSSDTGKVYGRGEEGVKALQLAEKGVRAATEVVHFKIPAPGTPYGVPRWVGNLYSVLGTNKADEVNYLYFDNKTVPPMALLVSGGSLGKNAVEKIENFIEEELKGAENFHKILIIEAESPTGLDGELTNGKLKIELKPLTDAQQRDGLFMKYEERSTDRVGMSFRIPRLLRGDVRDFNRATSESALKFTESQVFGPERNEFDHTMNQVVLASLGVRYWSFVSNAVQITNPEDMAKVIAELFKAGALWPSLAIELLSEYVFNRELPIPKGDWAELPVILTQTGLRVDEDGDAIMPEEPAVEGDAAGEAPTAARSARTPAMKSLMRARMSTSGSRAQQLHRFVKDLMAARTILEDEETKAAKAEFAEGKVVEEQENGHAPEEPRVIRMSVQDMAKKLGVVPAGMPARRRRQGGKR